MAWFFSRRDRDEDRQFVRHCQMLFAHQQHAMEVFNDGMTAAAGVASVGNPMPAGNPFARWGVNLQSPAAVQHHLLPAAEKKIAIVERMRQLHEALPEPQERRQREVHLLLSNLLDAIEIRATEQATTIERWVTDPAFNPSDMTSPGVDAAEQDAMTAAILQLNALIEKAGLGGPDFIAINCEAFNEVRAEAGLPQLPLEEFGAMYFALISGAPVRFFTQG